MYWNVAQGLCYHNQSLTIIVKSQKSHITQIGGADFAHHFRPIRPLPPCKKNSCFKYNRENKTPFLKREDDVLCMFIVDMLFQIFTGNLICWALFTILWQSWQQTKQIKIKCDAHNFFWAVLGQKYCGITRPISFFFYKSSGKCKKVKEDGTYFNFLQNIMTW